MSSAFVLNIGLDFLEFWCLISVLFTALALSGNFMIILFKYQLILFR